MISKLECRFTDLQIQANMSSFKEVIVESGMVNRKRSNDDEDFVTPPPPYISTVGQIQVESHASQPDEQRNIVASIGFGATLSMQLGKLPRMLSYWVVDSYNPATSSIRVNGQTIVVTRETIHDIYGIPMGYIPMSNPLKANHEDDVVRVWKSQFPKEVKRIRLNHVIQKIVNDSQVGPLFIMNFLVLYVSVMIGFPSMGTVNQSFLENIKLDVDINRLDWCGFVLTCLNASRITWNRHDDKCVFTGPAAFILLFYLRFTKMEYGSKEVKTHALIFWTTERLKLREQQEIEKGRFGNVVFHRMVIGDLVDAWDNEGWWVGRYTRREGDNYIVVFD
ncbi:hypothetical protein LXL04_013563 [Taraxacum kok-saghyz]